MFSVRGKRDWNNYNCYFRLECTASVCVEAKFERFIINICVRYGVVANISRSHNLREKVPRSPGFDSLYRSLSFALRCFGHEELEVPFL